MRLNKSQHNAEVHTKIAEQYSEKYFIDETDHPFFEEFIAMLPVGGRLLDIACGPGMFTKYFLERGFLAEGIDLSPKMIAIAKQKVPGANFQVMDMRQLKFGDAVFDALLVAYALIFIPSSETGLVLSEFHRILKPQGKLMIICQEGEGDHEEREPMKPDETLYVNFYSGERLKAELEKTDFKVIKQEVTQGDDLFGSSTGLIYSFAEKTQ